MGCQVVAFVWQVYHVQPQYNMLGTYAHHDWVMPTAMHEGVSAVCEKMTWPSLSMLVVELHMQLEGYADAIIGSIGHTQPYSPWGSPALAREKQSQHNGCHVLFAAALPTHCSAV